MFFGLTRTVSSPLQLNSPHRLPPRAPAPVRDFVKEENAGRRFIYVYIYIYIYIYIYVCKNLSLSLYIYSYIHINTKQSQLYSHHIACRPARRRQCVAFVKEVYIYICMHGTTYKYSYIGIYIKQSQ